MGSFRQSAGQLGHCECYWVYFLKRCDVKILKNSDEDHVHCDIMESVESLTIVMK